MYRDEEVQEVHCHVQASSSSVISQKTAVGERITRSHRSENVKGESGDDANKYMKSFVSNKRACGY